MEGYKGPLRLRLLSQIFVCFRLVPPLSRSSLLAVAPFGISSADTLKIQSFLSRLEHRIFVLPEGDTDERLDPMFAYNLWTALDHVDCFLVT
jgi:hypothetical protein